MCAHTTLEAVKNGIARLRNEQTRDFTTYRSALLHLNLMYQRMVSEKL